MVSKILLLGECSREHAIAEAIARSGHKIRLYALMKHRNPGIERCCKARDGEIILGDFLDPETVLKVVRDKGIDLVVIGPEEPLFRGVVNAVEDVEGVPCIGPRREAAQIEQSKAFMRRLMWKYNIPGRLRFWTFRDVKEALEFIRETGESVAIKPARQFGGKGVKVIADFQAYLRDVRSRVKEAHVTKLFAEISKYTDIEDKILIEEKVEGIEYTLQCFTDGVNVLPLPLVQDYKHAYEYGIGPETGGMGSIMGPGITLPFITSEEYEKSVQIVKMLVEAVRKEIGVEYRGIISGQMMLTPIWGPTVIECYARFGDPEGVNVLSVLETDIVDIFEAILSRSLPKIKLEFKNVAVVVKAAAPLGYPLDRKLAQGHVMEIDEEKIEERGCKIYYGSVDQKDEGLITVGSRAVEIAGFGETIPEAAHKVNEIFTSNLIRLRDWKLIYRLDIGSRASVEKMIENAEIIRRAYKARRLERYVMKEWIPGRGLITYMYGE